MDVNPQMNEFIWRNISISYICENASLCHQHICCDHRERHEDSVYCHGKCERKNAVLGSKCEVFTGYENKHEKRKHNKFKMLLMW